MPTATLSSKGQLTVPAAVRAAMGLDTGSRVEFIDQGDGRFSIIAATSPVTSLKGMLAKPARPVSIEQMNGAIAEQASRAR